MLHNPKVIAFNIRFINHGSVFWVCNRKASAQMGSMLSCLHSEICWLFSAQTFVVHNSHSYPRFTCVARLKTPCCFWELHDVARPVLLLALCIFLCAQVLQTMILKWKLYRVWQLYARQVLPTPNMKMFSFVQDPFIGYWNHHKYVHTCRSVLHKANKIQWVCHVWWKPHDIPLY